ELRRAFRAGLCVCFEGGEQLGLATGESALEIGAGRLHGAPAGENVPEDSSAFCRWRRARKRSARDAPSPTSRISPASRCEKPSTEERRNAVRSRESSCPSVFSMERRNE